MLDKIFKSLDIEKNTIVTTKTGLEIKVIGPSVLPATSGLAEQLRETNIFGIFPLLAVAVAVTLLAFTPEGIVVGF